ncbi:DUF2339 domain-containing protein [Fibrella arboris]|uniref:DUF2339 domain-containing protein n=1 Tax=Fibrella arboris TaxID=3242486 RepID=UPI003522FC78
MESLYILLLIVLFLYLNQQFVQLKKSIADQRDNLLQLQKTLLINEQGRPPVATVLTPDAPVRPVSPQGSPVVPPPVSVPDPVAHPTINPAPVVPKEVEPVLSIATPEPLKAVKPNLLDDSLLDPPAFAAPTPSWFRRFLAENPDLEKFIGENLINKIGIAILVAGIGYFVRYAIAQEWIGEMGRVLIGVAAGGGLLAIAHRMRQRFAAFSSVLVAGGLSVLYFTIAIAFSDYEIFSQTAAFLLMVVITGFAVALSIAYNRVELAVMSLIGGFATPFMVSSGQGNYIVLFTYILILDVGMLVLSSFKKWPLVHGVAYGLTVLLFGSWLATDVLDNVPSATSPTPPYIGAFVFGSLFYSLFAAMNLFDRLRHDTRFSALDVSLFMSNTAFYYGAGMGVLAAVDEGSWQGPFTLALAVINFGYAALLRRRHPTDTTLFYLLIGLVITFASLTIPVQLNGNFITMFWALEAVLLLWLSQRSGLRLVATASVIVLGLMGISLLMDWTALYNTAATPPLPIIINRAFITSAVSVAGIAAYYRLLSQQAAPVSVYIGEWSIPSYRRFVGYVAVLVGYLAGIVELDYQLLIAYGYDANRVILLGTYNLLVAAAFLYLSLRSAGNQRLWGAVLFSLVILFIYLFNTGPAVLDLLDSYYQGLISSRSAFLFHYVNLLAVGIVLALLFRAKERLAPAVPLLEKLWPWFLVSTVVSVSSMALFANAIAFTFSSAEIARSTARQLAVQLRFDALIEQTNKVGLPIVWGICAFAFMYAGLVRRNRTYRVLSLSLFAITLLKLFIYDIQGISEGGRILAFISLGALLLVISFMYQRIKRLLAADEAAV